MESNGETKFLLGVLSMTPSVKEELSELELAELYTRHSRGDWGDLPDEDKKENELSVKHGFRIMSKYTVRDVEYYVITEADRSATTILHPDEY